MSAVLVTGASGFLGRHIMRELQKRDIPAFALVRAGRPPEAYANFQILRDDGDVQKLADDFKRQKISRVIHVATIYPADETAGNAMDILNANLLFGGKILEASRLAGVTGFVNMGTFSQFGENGDVKPNSLYAATKQAFSEMLSYYADWHDLNAITLVLYDLYGPGDTRPKLLPELISAARTGNSMDATPGLQKMVPLHVRDAVAAVILALENLSDGTGSSNPNQYVCGDEVITVRELARVVETVSGRAMNVNWGARPYRSNQLMVPFVGPKLSGWEPKIKIAEGVEELLREWDDTAG
ncbi:NAD(P)-dependent oxidoreductase [uncultured Roseibium sp.]|uniref:NAD-dependent epimerase/dehydratase family protein n=1 Tax=uncultured Roseibium sp. TaxID=1936171 RepID=UPI002635344A|nr:NAD(P)-dependent oxidoreductase [uncultured Roseibium sp.]